MKKAIIAISVLMLPLIIVAVITKVADGHWIFLQPDPFKVAIQKAYDECDKKGGAYEVSSGLCISKDALIK